MRVRAIALSAFVCACLLTACGGGGGGSSTGTTAAPTGATANPAAVAGALALAPAECQAVIRALATGPAAAITGNTNVDFSQTLDYLRRVANAAPSEIKDDLGVIVDAYGKFVTAIRESGVDFTKPQTMTPDKLEKLQAAVGQYDQEKLSAASQRVDAYFTSHCQR